MPNFDIDAVLRQPPELPKLTIPFRFSISTGDDYCLRENLSQSGYSEAEIKRYCDTRLTDDWMALERNGLDILRYYFTVRDEGHSYCGLIGTAWVDLGTVAWNRLKDVGGLDNDEPFSTTSGSLHALLPPGPDITYRGVSEMGQRCLDLSISFFDTDELKEWADYEAGDGPLPVYDEP